MYLEKLKYFIDLVQTGSFTKAGKKNFVSQASIRFVYWSLTLPVS
jgi:DNA-binding transcriptional LysR family regulator